MATRFSLDPLGVLRVGVPTGDVGDEALVNLGEPGGVAYSSGSTSSSSSSIVRVRRTIELGDGAEAVSSVSKKHARDY